MQSHGAVQNILTRVFGILMLVIIVVCAMNISVTYKNYNNITKSSDIIAFKRLIKKAIIILIIYITLLQYGPMR